jgi:glucosamine--fructose-6-phosphate aminotransferase (isomerizing)
MSQTILEQEIQQQPSAVQRLLDEERPIVAKLAEDLRGKFDYVLIAARGTSDNAARYAQYLYGAHNHWQVALATPSLYTSYHTPPSLKGALVVGISQSGRSPDIIAVIEEGRRQGRPTLVVTNEPKSPLAQAADHVINLQAGPERAVAATKTYTTSLAALALVSCALAPDKAMLAQLEKLPALMQQALDSLGPRLARVERYRYMDRCAVLGRGFNYATAFEISLKVKELTRTVAEPYSSADFLHGPVAMVQGGFPVMVVAPTGQVLEDMRALVQRLIQSQAERIIISDDADLLTQAHLALPLPAGTPEWLSPAVAVLPGQLFGLALAQARGLSPDKPEGITKVTETW